MEITLQTLRNHILYAKFNKCEFWLDNVVFLRHVISKDVIYVDPKKIEVVINWPRPTNATEIRTFLGLVGYYKKFIKGFYSISCSLTNWHIKEY